LEAVGLIRKTRKTIGVERGSQVCNLYRFTDIDVYAFPKLDIDAMSATHDYLEFQSLGVARDAVRRASAPKKRTLQNLTRHATDFVVGKPISAADSVVTPPRGDTKTVARARSRNGCESSAGAALRTASRDALRAPKPTTDSVHLY
jgi:hypothetical protein